MKIAARMCCLLFLGVFSLSVVAQQPSKGQRPTFDVISVKLDKSAEGMWWQGGMAGFTTKHVDFANLLRNAFQLKLEEQMVGLPSWEGTQKFEITAKMEEPTIALLKSLKEEEAQERYMQMMQNLLIDRFHLKYHYEKRSLPVYNLLVAKSGLKIKTTASKPEERGMSMGANQLDGKGMTLDSLGYSLSGLLNGYVNNMTGLTGSYDISLRWTSDEGAAKDTASAPLPMNTAPSIFVALQEQAGLKLEASKGMVDVVVIDHVELPTEN